MGQVGSSNSKVRLHLETATKTGALVLTGQKLAEMPDLSVVSGSLRTLDLSVNKLTHLTPSVTEMATLKHLQLSDNRLESLPEDMGKLKKLESLTATNNNIASLPQSMSQLTHLKSVNISHNGLSSFPTCLCLLPQLDLLDLSHNSITALPEQLATLTVVELNLSQNQVSSISPALSQCSRLKTLRLEENCLALDALPEELLTDSQVSLLCVSGNLFSNKQLEETPAYVKYMERYTATKKKMF